MTDFVNNKIWYFSGNFFNSKLFSVLQVLTKNLNIVVALEIASTRTFS